MAAPRWSLRTFGTLLMVLCAARGASAQLLHGSVTDGGNTPIAGVLITVRDSANSVRARVLTDAAGRFSWLAAPGAYRITAEHIGFAQSTRSATVAAKATPVQFALKPAPIALAAVVAHGSARCRTTNDPEAAKVWSLARTALGAAAAQTSKQFRTRVFTRYLDLNLREVAPERSEFQIGTGRSGFRAISLDSLLRFGFVQNRGSDRYFFGPDAELLLADEFVNAYCFGVVREHDRPGLIGLSYWPQERRKVPGIRGTMWLDERNGILKFVEYSFTGIDVNPRYANGRVDFERLPDHTWFVRYWYIRMPQQAQVPTGATQRVSVIGIQEGGGEVLGVDSTATRTRAGQIRGVVYDSIARAPLTDADVYLSGTSYAGKSDDQGNFNLTEVREGTYYISFFHPTMRTLPAFPNLTRLQVRADTTMDVALAIPPETVLVASYCSAAKLDEAAQRLEYPVQRLAVIAGIVRSSQAVIEGTRVHVKWDARTLPPRAINRGVTGAWVEPAADGTYAICGVPIELDLTLELIAGERVEYREFMRGRSVRAIRKDIELN